MGKSNERGRYLSALVPSTGRISVRRPRVDDINSGEVRNDGAEWQEEEADT